MFCAAGEVEEYEPSQAKPTAITSRTRKVCQHRPIGARTDRAFEFYSASKPLSKRLEKLARLNRKARTRLAQVSRQHTLLPRFIQQRIDLALQLLLLVLQPGDLLVHWHAVVPLVDLVAA